MAIDTAAKRRSEVATRRLPWFRRFLPAPDATIDQGDRQQIAFVYRGIAAEAETETHPGAATFQADGPGSATFTATGPGGSTFTRSGPGAATFSRKQS